MEAFVWMAWTWPTGIFFIAIALTLSLFTWLAVNRPEVERVGVLRIATTRGDRLFLSLLGAAIIHIVWLATLGNGLVGVLPMGDGIELTRLWGASLLSVAYAVAVFRYV
jgi:predicted small integral membrane protein